jgi:hypothetical protein
MASGLIGISVAVTLQNPPDTVVYGTVAAVNSQTATLTLQDGEIMHFDSEYAGMLTYRSLLSGVRTSPELVPCRRARDR